MPEGIGYGGVSKMVAKNLAKKVGAKSGLKGLSAEKVKVKKISPASFLREKAALRTKDPKKARALLEKANK